METYFKILLITSTVGFLIMALINIDRSIAKIESKFLQQITRSLLYAALFTPTIYHHAPNTIIGPFHMPTIAGNLFYNYDYSISMFMYGVILPVIVAWGLIFMFFIVRDQFLSLSI